MGKRGRPKPPACDKCGKALYKSPKHSRVPIASKKMPYAFCRNELCDNFGVDQHGQDRAKWVQGPIQSESQLVKKARGRIETAIQGNPDLAPNVVGLALALLAQSMGSNRAANALIDQYELTKLYGVQKIDAD